MQACWDDIFINYNMYRRNINIKTKCGQHTGKALSNHESFSPSQSHETVPLIPTDIGVTYIWSVDTYNVGHEKEGAFMGLFYGTPWPYLCVCS